MKTVKDALAVYEELNISERLTFYITLTSQLNADKDDNLLMETHFPNSLYCVHCKSNNNVMNGHRKWILRSLKHSYAIKHSSCWTVLFSRE